jgi:hypothetical protein
MSYQLNKTDGSLLTELIDGVIDIDSTPLTLVGRNTQGYGEAINENFIKILENFANTNAPSNPLKGQLWFDTSENTLKVYNGAIFQTAGGTFIQANRPQAPVAGEFWIDTQNQRLEVYDGRSWILVGPQYTSAQRETGFRVEAILDTTNTERTVAKLFIGGVLVAVYSGLEFTPVLANRIGELVTLQNPRGTIRKGVNVVGNDFVWNGTAEQTQKLIDSNGVAYLPGQFVQTLGSQFMEGPLKVSSANGITIGSADNNVQKVVNNTFVIENQQVDQDIKLRVRSSAAGNQIIDGLVLDASTRRIGMFQSFPAYTLDVNGDVRVSGNLIVDGDTTNVNVQTLQIEDKNIELGISTSGVQNDDAGATGGGITLKSTAGDKSITWENADASWTSSEHFDLAIGKSYKINGANVLNSNSLGTGITSANGLTSIGTLQSLNVDNLNFDGRTITASGGGLSIITGGDISINTRKITGLADPTANSDATNKLYVDTQIRLDPIVMSLDITGFLNVDAEVVAILQALYPATTAANGKQAKIHTFAYTTSTAQINVQAALNTSSVTVVDSVNFGASSTTTTSALGSVSFNTALGSVDFQVTRSNRTYQIVSGSWTVVL